MKKDDDFLILHEGEYPFVFRGPVVLEPVPRALNVCNFSSFCIQ